MEHTGTERAVTSGSAPPLPPDQMGLSFRECLGTGRFGEVYLAAQHTRGGISRLVAVKILREEFDEDSDAVRRLKDEGQILAMLAHPAIVGVHEFMRIDGRLALLTEFIEGIDLSGHCSPKTRLPPRVAVGIISEVAGGLDWALRTKNPKNDRPLNLIHRDIKPSNIRLSVYGQVKLLDFGLARSNEMKRHARTVMGDVLGTAGFAAPEALAFGVASPATDVYALGSTLYHLITGQALYEGLAVEQQARLSLDSRDYQDFVTERLRRIEDDDLRVLVAEMVAFTPETRPSAGEVCEIADEYARTMDGPSLQQWARTAADDKMDRTLGLQKPAKLGPFTRDQWLIVVAIALATGFLFAGFASLLIAVVVVLG